MAVPWLLSATVSVVGVMMSAAHFPQAYKILQRRSSRDVSLITATVFAIGDWIWLAYGIALGELPIIASFSVGVFGATSVLALAVYFRNGDPTKNKKNVARKKR